MTACGTGEGFGAVTWWGFSPAMDFQEKGLTASMKALSSKEDNVSELNILVVGAGDSRHLLTTIARAHRWPRRKINFYVVENNLELMGRHLLFLTVALEPPGQMGLQEKSELLLELFGNSLIRSQTAAYLQDKANLFIRYVTDLDFLHKQLPMINMSDLKFKERDQLEAIFKFWRNPDPKVFQISRMWDLRNRQYLGNRYDSKQGAYDWDLHMKLYDRGARVINNRQYYQWREKGLAFEVREGLYDVSNKSLASGLLLNYKGEKVPSRGYWGDIVTSPYIAFGIETEEQSLLKTANGVHIKTAQDISQYNITALLHELVAKERYALLQPTEQATLSEITEEEEEGETENDSSNKKDESTHTSQQPGIVLEAGPVKQNNEMDNSGSGGGSCTAENDYLPLPDVKIHFLPVSCVTELCKKSIYNNRFNVIYFSCSMVHQLTPELEQISAPQATLIVELTKFMLDLRIELIAKFSSRVTEMAREAGFVPFGNVDDEKDSFARFELKNDP